MRGHEEDNQNSSLRFIVLISLGFMALVIASGIEYDLVQSDTKSCNCPELAVRSRNLAVGTG